MNGASPMLQAAKLWEKTSAAGNTYFVGRLGGVRILILRNRDAGSDGEPDWHMFFADGSPRVDTDATRKAAPQQQRRPRSPATARRPPAGNADPRPLLNDEIPEL